MHVNFNLKKRKFINAYEYKPRMISLALIEIHLNIDAS